MATPLTDIYDFFLSKVSDYSFIRLNNTGDLEAVLYKYLRSAVVKFVNCNKDLTIDEVNQQFVSDLDMDEKEILATLMAVEYVSNQILNEKNMKQVISDKDYKIHSQANHLQELLKIKKDLVLEASQLMSDYSLKNHMGDLL
jgi:DNA-binding transcriptional regulator YbjK